MSTDRRGGGAARWRGPARVRAVKSRRGDGYTYEIWDQTADERGVAHRVGFGSRADPRKAEQAGLARASADGFGPVTIEPAAGPEPKAG